jgi:predicted amidophosphoribosyltransferase
MENSIGGPELIVGALAIAVVALVVFVVVRVVKLLSNGPGTVPCPACSKHVSRRATACPHCGDPRAV